MNILKTIFAIQTSLFASLEEENLDPMDEKEKQFVRILALAQIERFTGQWSPGRMGRPKLSRQAIARAFIYKALCNFPTTEMLVETLKKAKNPRRLCGWEHKTDIPSLSTFSRAFCEFAAGDLPALIHEALVKQGWGDKLAGHVSRDATEIEAREKAVKKPNSVVKKRKPARGRPRKGEAHAQKQQTRLELQGNRTLQENLADLPTACDWGSKCNSKGHVQSWRGYKLHLDVVDGDVPVSALLTSASLHDSQASIPMAQRTAGRISSCYDLMDIAYDSPQIHAFSRSLGHVPLIAPNPRYKDRTPLGPAQVVRFRQRTSVERVYSALKDSHGGRFVRVRGASKVFAHLMFGVLVITANQLLHLLE
jgi:hypothetical protein